MRQLQTATWRDVSEVLLALQRLRDARDGLRKVGARKTYRRVVAALRSCDGALRHVRRRFALDK